MDFDKITCESCNETLSAEGMGDFGFRQCLCKRTCIKKGVDMGGAYTDVRTRQ